ncbi:hypothetical protein [Chryseobacterium daeguense]|nr:hypothetical protein [Chryseobacterium daeguense]
MDDQQPRAVEIIDKGLALHPQSEELLLLKTKAGARRLKTGALGLAAMML